MATIDNITTSQIPANVGIGSKYFNPKLVKGALIVPKGTIITTANLSTLQTVLQGLAQNDTKDARLYPIANFVDFKDNSEKPVTQSFGYGAEVTVRDGIQKWAFQFIKGGKTLNDALRTFNGDLWDFFFVDQKNVLFGKTCSTGIQAIPSIEIYTDPLILNDGKKIAEYVINFKFDPKYLNEEGAFIADADFDILDTIFGLQDLVLTGVLSGTAKTLNLTVKSIMGQNIGALYTSGTTGLGNKAVWTCVDDGGASVTISTMTWNSLGYFVAVCTTGYPVSGKVHFNLVGPTALAAAGVAGFESAGEVAITAV